MFIMFIVVGAYALYVVMSVVLGIVCALRDLVFPDLSQRVKRRGRWQV